MQDAAGYTQAHASAERRSLHPDLLAVRIMWSNHKEKKYPASYSVLTHWTVIETIVQTPTIYSAALIFALAM